MKTTKLISLAVTAIVALASTAWAGPQGGGSGRHFGGGHLGGGHFSGFSAGHFGGARVGSFNGGGIRAAPPFSGGGGAGFGGNRSIGRINRTPQQFSYCGGARGAAIVPR